MHIKKFFNKTVILFSVLALISYSQVGLATISYFPTNTDTNIDTNDIGTTTDTASVTTSAKTYSFSTPLMVAGAAAGMGIIAALFLKSSGSNNTSSSPPILSIVDDQGQALSSGQDIQVIALPSTSTFTVTNSSQTAWLSPSVTLSSTSGITMGANTCIGSQIIGGGTCYFQLIASASAGRLMQNIFSTTGTLGIAGSNLTTMAHNVTVQGGLAVTPENSNIYLSARAIKLANTSGRTITLDTPTISGLDGKVQFCAYGSGCSHTSDCTSSLSSGSSCRLWFEALANTSAGIGSSSGTITVNVGPANAQTTMNVSYEQDLYAGGWFTMPPQYIAKWNGSAWSALGNGMGYGADNLVWTLATMGDDLYAGGRFTQAGTVAASNIAKWDGSAWSALGAAGAEGLNSEPLALTAIGNNLYVGGVFTKAAGGTVIANHIAKWDGTTWSALGNGASYDVQALTAIGNNLYVGGQFTTVGEGITANNIAKWDSSGSSWSALNDGVQNGVPNSVRSLCAIGTDLYAGLSAETHVPSPLSKALFKWNGAWDGGNISGDVISMATDGTNLYVGGGFSSDGTTFEAHMGEWNGSNLQYLGGKATTEGAINDWVNGLVTLGNILYAGGDFTLSSGNYVAKWDSSRWTGLGTIQSETADNVVFTVLIAPALTITSP